MLYTLKETAALLKTSTWTVRQKIRAGELTARKLGPRNMRVDPNDLQVYLQAVSTRPMQAGPDRVAATVQPPQA